jgi:dienelactone hydrolase
MSKKLTATLCISIALFLAPRIGAQDKETVTYDPLRLDESLNSNWEDLTIPYADGKREVPVRVYLAKPEGATMQRPVILFSHGLGGSREGSPHIGKHWAQRGYCAIFLQHPGSDTGVWKDVPMRERMKALNNAASGENFQLRTQDVKNVLDRLSQWQQNPGLAPKEWKDLVSRMDLERIGMSGHSFGAVTAQAVSGQKFPLGRGYIDLRIKAAIIMSPSSPKLGSVETAFGSVNIPLFIMTGTKDTSPIGKADVASRLAVYASLPKGDKFELVLLEAEHSFPGERSLPGESGKRNPNHSKAVLALSTAFWDTYLREETAARSWLQGDGPKSILESGDSWKSK